MANWYGKMPKPRKPKAVLRRPARMPYRKPAKRPAGKVSTALLPELKSKNSGVRYFAVETLGKLKQPEAIPLLMEALKDKSAKVRWVAVIGISDIGAVAKTKGVVETLKKIKEKDPDENVRWAAETALSRILKKK